MVEREYVYMSLEEKLLETPVFTELVEFARWYAKNQANLIQDKPKETVPSAVRVAVELHKLGKIPEQKGEYFRRQMNSVDYILNTQIQDEGDNSINLMRNEIERILDNVNIELLFYEGRFSYDKFRRTIRENINRDLFTRRDTNELVSDKFLDRGIFFSSELWGEEYVLKYLLEKYDYSISAVGKKLKIRDYQVSKKLSENGIKIKELKQSRYKVIQDEGVCYILLRNEQEMSKVYFTEKNLTEILGISRQGFWSSLHKRVKMPKDPSVRPTVRLSSSVYRDILDSYSDSALRNFSVSVTGEHNYTVHNHGESGYNPTPYTGRELRINLGVAPDTFSKIIKNVLGIPAHTRNRYSFSGKAFLGLVAMYGPK